MTISSAAGGPLLGVQDDGGYSPDATTFVSQAEVATKLTRFVVTLTSYANSSDAQAGYQTQAAGTPSPFPGVPGGVAARSGGVVIQKGAQVVGITAKATPDGNDQIASQGKSPDVIQQILTGPLIAVSNDLVARISGAPAGHAYQGLPSGALDPCGVPASELATALKTTVTSRHQISESPPAQQCTYSIDSRPFYILTYTGAQAVAATPATTLADVYTADLARRGASGETQQFNSSHIQAFMYPDGLDFGGDVLISLPIPKAGSLRGVAPALQLAGRSSSATTDTPIIDRSGGLVLVRIENGYTFTVSHDDCIDLWKSELIGTPTDPGPLLVALAQLNQVDPPAADAARASLISRVQEWCSGLADPNTTPPA